MSTAESLEPQGSRPADTFAVRLRVLRYDLGRLSVEEVAEKCGVKTATWSTWENGAMPRDMGKVVRQIALATGYDIDWLMWGGPLTVIRCLSETAQVRGLDGPEGVHTLAMFDEDLEPIPFRKAELASV